VADCSALLAVIVFKHKAFRGTSIADGPADVTDVFGFRVIHGHGLYGKVTYICAKPEHFDTIRPSFCIRFLQAGIKALVADLQALIAGIDTSLILGN
jgi:hypothetical protein